MRAILTEFEVTRLGGQVALTFLQKPTALTNAKMKATGLGVYVIYHNISPDKSIPIYVGQGKIKQRLLTHQRCLEFSDRNPSKYSVQWANISQPSPDRLKLAEHALIIEINKYLAHSNSKLPEKYKARYRQLRNQSSLVKFRVKQKTLITISGLKIFPHGRSILAKPNEFVKEIEFCDSLL